MTEPLILTFDLEPDLEGAARQLLSLGMALGSELGGVRFDIKEVPGHGLSASGRRRVMQLTIGGAAGLGVAGLGVAELVAQLQSKLQIDFRIEVNAELAVFTRSDSAPVTKPARQTPAPKPAPRASPPKRP